MSEYYQPMRTEQTVFDELASLCVSKGFIHALARICFRDTVVGLGDDFSTKDLVEMRSRSRLIRTELTTLIGLTMRGPIDFALPEPELLSYYIQHAEFLLEELHRTLLLPPPEDPDAARSLDNDADAPTFGRFLREQIFYGGESAYPFQYRDFAPRKYADDSDWLLANKGIRLEIGQSVCRGIADILNNRLYKSLIELRDKPTEEWTVFPGFIFSCAELARHIGQPVEDVRAFVMAFALTADKRNPTFTSLNAFNAAYAYPLIHYASDKFILLQYYGLSEAFYDTPFYWMYSDVSYRPIASDHRGDFAETFTAERMSLVFGTQRVFKNVEAYKSKGETLGEIDILVIFGDRIIVVQAKSKRLTLAARKGNDRALRKDFKNAVQDAVDQSYSCSQWLCDRSTKLRCRDGRPVELSVRPRMVFAVTVVTDHYPTLAFQARHFLKVKSTEQILPPLVADVFAVDAITEFLSSPLRLLSYLYFRACHSQKIMAGHEHMILSYHLKQNLWFGNDVDFVLLEDDVSSDLDVAMVVRREGIPGTATPDGILTRFAGTPFSRIISELEEREEPVAINFGFMLLELSEETVQRINEYIEEMLKRSVRDNDFHNVVIGISEASTGLTVHCSSDTHHVVESRLRLHSEFRKYTEKANSWFGLAMTPTGSIRLVAELVGDWKEEPAMEQKARPWIKRKSAGSIGKRKIGRNDPCYCGSGRKYKRCCMNR